MASATARQFQEEQRLVHAAVLAGGHPQAALLRVSQVVKARSAEWASFLRDVWLTVGWGCAGPILEQVRKQAQAQAKSGSDLTPPDNLDDRWASQVEDYIQQTAGQKVVGITDTTLAQLLAALQAGIDAGESIDQLAQRVDQLYLQDIIPNRSETIARTETISASNYGSQQAALSTGLPLLKTWIATPDIRCRLEHREADGQTVPMDQPYLVGGYELMYPGDPAAPAHLTVNCRCVEGYKRAEDTTSTDDTEAAFLGLGGGKPSPTSSRGVALNTAATNELAKVLPNANLDLRNLDTHLVAQTVEQLGKLAAQFPDVAARFRYAGALQDSGIVPGYSRLDQSAKDFEGGRALAYTTPHTGLLALNPRYYADERRLLKELKIGGKTGWHVPVHKDQYGYYTVTHEFGHQVRWALLDSPDLGAHLRQIEDRYAHSKLDIGASAPSVYGQTNKDELFAETFTSWWFGLPARSPYMTAVYHVLDEAKARGFTWSRPRPIKPAPKPRKPRSAPAKPPAKPQPPAKKPAKKPPAQKPAKKEHSP